MADSFDYTPNDLINPIGTNNLSSFALYYQRSLYLEKNLSHQCGVAH